MAASAPMMEAASGGVRDFFSAISSSEARYFDEERYSEADIRKGLSDSFTDRKIDSMKRILAAVSVGRDASPLFPDVVKNVSFQSLELKKLIYIYLVQYAENNRDLALLSINSFQKDLTDRSQLVRASALRAMSSTRVLEVIQLVMVAVRNASNDQSAYVRKTAAQCMTKVYAVDPDQFFELRKLLLKLMSDQEVQVVGSAVMAFHHLCVARPPPKATAAAAAGADGEGGTEGEGGEAAGPDEALKAQLSLLHPHFRRLCQEILLMDPWAQQCCVDVLTRYCRLFFKSPDTQGQDEAKPEPSEDLSLFLKSLKLLLCSSSKSVTLAAVVALCYLAPAEDHKMVMMPMLRCLRQASPESANALLVAMTPIINTKPELVRSQIREFFVQSFDYPTVKEMKLKMLERLVDETNVQLVLRELQTYVLWQSHPEFVGQSVRSISQVALKIPSVADSCLRGLVKMLDSKCEALSCEAVVALRALLQRRQQSSESGLGSVLPHLASYLENLAAPTARASVVWIIGHYQREVPRLGPDVVRRLAKSFATERQEVKQQTLGLSLKVWAFHTLNAQGKLPEAAPANSSEASNKASQPQSVTPEESSQVLPRLEAIVDHISHLASFDASWDVRDSARVFKKLRDAAKAGGGIAEEGAADKSLQGFGAWYCRNCMGGQSVLEDSARAAEVADEDEARAFKCQWILGSLAQALDYPLETYKPLPTWAQEDSPDHLRKVQVAAPSAVTAPKSISSANIGNVQHMETRVQAPSNIPAKPQVAASLEELDLFYSADQLAMPQVAARGPAGGAAAVGGGAAEPPPITLENMQLGGTRPAACAVGTAVFGEDDESEEEESAEEPDNDDDWKYCTQASAAAPEPAPSAAAPEPAPAAAAPEPAPAAAAPPPTQEASGEDASAAVTTEAPAVAFSPPPRVEEPAPAAEGEQPPVAAAIAAAMTQAEVPASTASDMPPPDDSLI